MEKSRVFVPAGNTHVEWFDRMIERGASGLRRSVHYELTDDDIELVMREALSISIPLEALEFERGDTTGYNESTDKIIIKGNIFPSPDASSHPRDVLTIRAVLAHEWYGHRKFRGTPLAIGDWKDEFRASYTAAVEAPGLSDVERYQLMLDAMARAKEAFVTISYNNRIREVLHGRQT
jgi:hypothetical protein